MGREDVYAIKRSKKPLAGSVDEYVLKILSFALLFISMVLEMLRFYVVSH